MADADRPIPKFKNYAEGEPIPPVDPEELKRRWNIKPPWTREAMETAWRFEADISAVSHRARMIRELADYNRGQLLAPWHHGEQLDDAVFRIAATFPLHVVKFRPYIIAGDEIFGFDPNAFVQRLIEKTGISHTWEPVAIKMGEGGRNFVMSGFECQPRNLELEAKRQTRELVWNIWKRFAPSLDQVLSACDKEHASEVVATFFSDFLLDNIDLVRQLEAAFKEPQSIPLDPILTELEQRAQGRV